MTDLIYIAIFTGVIAWSGPRIIKLYSSAKQLVTMYNSIETPVETSTQTLGDMKIIKYEHGGELVNITVPYNEDYVYDMSGVYMSMVSSEDTIDITQEPGTPYTCSPNQLGVKYLTATNYNNDKTHTYTGDEIPMYCTHVL